jgi:hypothetical protein
LYLILIRTFLCALIRSFLRSKPFVQKNHHDRSRPLPRPARGCVRLAQGLIVCDRWEIAFGVLIGPIQRPDARFLDRCVGPARGFCARATANTLSRVMPFFEFVVLFALCLHHIKSLISFARALCVCLLCNIRHTSAAVVPAVHARGGKPQQSLCYPDGDCAGKHGSAGRHQKGARPPSPKTLFLARPFRAGRG